VIVGLGYTWWQQGHNRHHANPNVVGRDPSVDAGAFVFQDDDVAKRPRAARRIIPVQGWLLPPALLLEGVVLHVQSFGPLLKRRVPAAQRLELLLLVLRLSLFPLLVFSVLPAGLAAGFLAVQLGVFGLYLGGSFVPNHVGMPLVRDARELDYLRKQVLTARNISGGVVASTITGGLSLQIEHHLFPGMPRPNLLKARPLVRRYCAELGIPYFETSYPRAALDVIHHMNRVGIGDSRFSCPLVEECGRS
jgi:fatty acid desaturase